MLNAVYRPPSCAWKISATIESRSFSWSNLIHGFADWWFFLSFIFIVSSRGSWSLSTSAPGYDIVFALLMLDLKRRGVGMKSIWLCIFPFDARHVVLREILCGCWRWWAVDSSQTPLGVAPWLWYLSWAFSWWHFPLIYFMSFLGAYEVVSYLNYLNVIDGGGGCEERQS